MKMAMMKTVMEDLAFGITSLKVLPLENRSENLRLKNMLNKNEIVFHDPEEATEFLKCFFDWNDEQIKEYWELE